MLAARILKEGANQIRIGASFLEVVESIETQVREEGAGLAFPLNLSVNEDAAHDTASYGDKRIFSKGDVVKLDLGVHIDGYIADTALTVDLGTNTLLLEASKEALKKAIENVKPGVTAGELGAVIQQTIEERGYYPVVNLTGHGLSRYQVHTSPTIPNIAMSGGQVLEEDMVFAIEPFASTGTGRVSDKTKTEIYRHMANKPVRLPSARQIIEAVRDRRGMPFARRWLKGDRLDLPLATLVRQGILHPFPVLSDVPGSLVSQAEHTVIVTESGCIVTTR